MRGVSVYVSEGLLMVEENNQCLLLREITEKFMIL